MIAGAVIVKAWDNRETLIPLAVSTGRRLQPVLSRANDLVRDHGPALGIMRHLPGGASASTDGSPRTARRGAGSRSRTKAGAGG